MTYKRRWKQVSPEEFRRIVMDRQLNEEDAPQVRVQFAEEVYVGRLVKLDANGIFDVYTLGTERGTITFGGDAVEDNPNAYFIERSDYLTLPKLIGAIVRTTLNDQLYVRIDTNHWVRIHSSPFMSPFAGTVNVYTDADLRNVGINDILFEGLV